MKARLPVVPIETRDGEVAPYRYWGAALALAAAAAWTVMIGAAWLVGGLI